MMTITDFRRRTQSHITSVVRQAYVKNVNDVQELCNRLTDIEKAVMSRKVLSM
jgi:hypothetical protein